MVVCLNGIMICLLPFTTFFFKQYLDKTLFQCF